MYWLYGTYESQLQDLPSFIGVQRRLFVRRAESRCPEGRGDLFAVKAWECRLRSSLADLAFILYKCYGRPCVILLDEFDVPFMEAELKCPCLPGEGEPSCECEKSEDLLSSMLKMALKVFASLCRALSTHFLFLGQPGC